MRKRIAWNKGLTKESNEGIARISLQKSKWWKEQDSTETRKKIGLASKNRVHGVREKSSGWKGGKYTDSRDGYVFIYLPENSMSRSDGYVLEHRLVMSKILGRTLEKNEDVNHINGKKNDNRPQNLQIVKHFAHYQQMCCPKCNFKFITR